MNIFLVSYFLSIWKVVGIVVSEGENGGEEEEEDPVIAAILRARDKPSEKPPEVEVEDYLADISFSPTSNIIAGGSVTGDALV